MDEIRNLTARMEENENSKRTIVKGFRVSIPEAARLKTAARMEHISEGEYIRLKVFSGEDDYIPFELRNALSDTLYEINRCSNGIRSIADGCVMHRSVNAYDVRKLGEEIDALRKQVYELFAHIRGKEGSHGSDKAPPD